MSAPPRPPRSTPPRGGAALTIAELGDVLDASVTGTSAATSVVTGVEQDSRRIGPGDLFVALRGGRVDGLRFAPAAIERGAVAVLTERVESLPELGVPLLVVDAARPALARAAAAVHRHPTRETTVIG
ncbi:MAG: Mur ligase domain-containing protein, partial [Polyangiaceae bacterium]